MSDAAFDRVPEPQRATARSVLEQVLGPGRVTDLQAVSGGASGALAYRVETRDRPLLLRIEAGLNARQNPNHYACMRAAADAGIAPALHFMDAAQGVALMDFVTQQPLGSYPGGVGALVRALGELIRRLQDGTRFPAPEISYPEVTGRLLHFISASRVFAPGLLEPHRAGFERVRDAFGWDTAALVSSHNDPNPRNILFDGTRLWLVDWETAYQNDPLVDVAVVTHELAWSSGLQEIVLESWLGRAPDRVTRARLVGARQLTRLFFACVLFRHFAGDPERRPDSDLSALTPEQFLLALQSKRLRVGTPQVLYEFGKMFLAAFSQELTTREFEDALVTMRAESK